MRRSSARSALWAVLGMAVALATWQVARRALLTAAPPPEPNAITIDYPAEGSIFPPEFPAPTWLWRDGSTQATAWEVEVSFTDGAPAIRLESEGARMTVGAIDPRASSSNNRPPQLTEEQVAAHTWTPDTTTWSTIKKHSVEHPARVVITGRAQRDRATIVSRGAASIQTSSDPVGAPIFYRDVPLMPSENEKGVIKPLDAKAVPLIAWRLRDVSEPESRLVMEGLHTCANCHSFSADGKTLGMDMDGPQNDKGLYAIVDVRPQMSIRNEDLVAWSSFRGALGSKLRVGFMSQLSPDGRHVITTINDPGVDQTDPQRRKEPIDLMRNYYVANFKDYRFLQVFFPTRGILAWYDRAAAQLKALPGADDTNYVHANAVWNPDGTSLVFARAPAQDAYPPGAQLAKYANDPHETQIRYDLYRIPFRDGEGGKPEPIAGASQNGMSNSFPKISPDGRWIVFVQARNGLLMRPDSQLYIVPAGGGTARRMKCNTSRMNSWHSFSPNGRWMVFSSKSRSPYTQMYLTHLDEAGNDSPAILIENTTAANRAVNIPEFVNIARDGLVKIEAPAAEYARHMDLALEAMKDRRYDVAVEAWKKALALAPSEPRAHNSLGVALTEIGQAKEAIRHYRQAVQLNPQYPEAWNNLGEALVGSGALEEAVAQFEKALALEPANGVARANLGQVLARTGQTDQAIVHLRRVVEAKPDAADARMNLGHALADKGDFEEASRFLEEAVRLSGGQNPLALHLLGRVYGALGRAPEALRIDRQALAIATYQKNARLIDAINAHLDALLTAQPPASSP